VSETDERKSRMTSLLTGEGLDISRNIVTLTSSGTDLDPNTDDLVNGMKVYFIPYSKMRLYGNKNRLLWIDERCN